MLLYAAQTLKAPLHFSTQGILGRFTLSESSCYRKIHEIAMIFISIISAIISIPFWFIGELVEICSNDGRKLFDDDVDLGNADEFLDPVKTKMIGTGTSTFQSTSDLNFCSGSAVHDALKDPKLGLGNGVDILTVEGRDKTIAALKAMNADTFRFSIEWADVIKNGMDKYVEAAEHFKRGNIKVVITLDHWIGNGKVNVFENSEDQDAFVEYAKGAYTALRPYVTHFLTFNEINVDASLKYVMGELPPKQILNFSAAHRLMNLKLDAHAKVYDALHNLEKSYTGVKTEGELQIGLSHQVISMKAQSRWNLIARIVAFVMSYHFHERFMERAEKMGDKLDFLGVQYYTRPLAGRNGLQIVDSIANKNQYNPYGWMVDGMRYRFDPQGILPTLQEVSSRINKPLLVTEIGTAGTCHERKAEYYKIATKAMRAAQNQGIGLIGALFWTLFPNLEWQHGYDPTTNFGILDSNGEKTPGFNFLSEANGKTFPKQPVGAAV